jgi:hypothetical protein
VESGGLQPGNRRLEIQQPGLVGEIKDADGSDGEKTVTLGDGARFPVVNENGGIAEFHGKRNGFVFTGPDTKMQIRVRSFDLDPRGEAARPSGHACRGFGIPHFMNHGGWNQQFSEQTWEHVNVADQYQVVERRRV